MDAATIRARIEAVWPQLPTVFTTRDVLARARMSKDVGSIVHAILDSMVGEGLLFHSLVAAKRLGRKPTAWSKGRSGLREEVLLATVREALERMPVQFTVDELLAAVGMSQRMRLQVRGALDRLADESAVIRLTDLPHAPGRKASIWSASSRAIADEIAFRARKAMALRLMETEDPDVRLNRMLKPWDPFPDGE